MEFAFENKKWCSIASRSAINLRNKCVSNGELNKGLRGFTFGYNGENNVLHCGATRL